MHADAELLPFDRSPTGSRGRGATALGHLGIGGSHSRSAHSPPITQSDRWNNDPISLGHRLNDEKSPWVTNPGNFSAEVDPQITALLTGFPQTPVRKVSDVLDPIAMGTITPKRMAGEGMDHS